jgi:hypothetical protein
MGMSVRGNQVHPLQQGNIVQNLHGGGFLHDLAFLENEAAI